MDFVNKYTVSVGVGAIYYWLNKLELLGESSDVNIEPVQIVVVVVLAFAACLAVEWAYRRQGFLPKLTLVPDRSAPSASAGFAMEPTAWNE